MNRSFLAWSCSLVVLATVSTASAQTSNPVLAEALFREGSALLKDGKVAEACAKLDESWKLDPAVGTLYNLAQCREKEGHLATAWTQYSELAGRAKQAGQADKEARMQAKLAELGPRLPKVRLKLEGRTDVTELKIDTQALGRAAWGSALPLDPGEHTFLFSGPNKEPLERKIVVAEGQELVLEIEPLRDAAPEARPAPAPALAASEAPHEDAPPRSNNTLGYALGGIGIAGLAVGSVFGILAIGRKSDADDLFKKRDPGFKDADDAASTNALVSTIGFGAAIVGLGAGAYFLFMGGTSKKSANAVPRIWASPVLHPGSGGLAACGTF